MGLVFIDENIIAELIATPAEINATNIIITRLAKSSNDVKSPSHNNDNVKTVMAANAEAVLPIHASGEWL